MNKYIYLLLSLIFVLFAYWQLNDPDPVLWVSVYLIAAFYSYKASKGQVNTELQLVLGLASFIAAANTVLQVTAYEGIMPDGLAMKTLNQELAREGLGLLIVGSSFVFNLLARNK
jgi:hypothetical protein